MKTVPRSKRRKVAEGVCNEDYQQLNINLPWSEADKKKLLEALKTYGPDDISSISKEFPKKTSATVEGMINKIYLIAKKNTMWKENQINTWLESGLFDDPQNIIPEVLKLIAPLEKHPEPSECAGCDYKEVYEVLARVTAGDVPENVSEMTLETICYALSEITEEIWPLEKEEVDSYIESLLEERSKKSYKSNKHF